jgi:hypothetical protein
MSHFKYFNSLFSLLLLFCIINTTIAQEVKILNKSLLDMVYVPQQDCFYAVSSQYDNPTKSMLYKINPYTIRIEDSVLIGSNIHKLAVTDNGRYLYIAELGRAIYRYDLSSKKIVLTISLNNITTDGVIQVTTVPQNPNKLVVTVGVSQEYADNIYLFEDDKVLAKSDFNRSLNTITFGKNPNVIYAYDSYSTGAELGLLRQNGSKLELFRNYTDYFRAFKGNLKIDENDYLYAERDGFRSNVKNIYPQLEGQIKPVVEKDWWVDVPASFQADPITDVIYALSSEYLSSGGIKQSYLSKYSKKSYLLLSKSPLVSNPTFDYFRKVRQWGSGKIAAMDAKKILFVRDCTPLSSLPTIEQGSKINVCQDSFITLKASDGFLNYFWTNGDTGKIIKIKFSDLSPYSIAVAATTSLQGCLSSLSIPITIQAKYGPSKPNVTTEFNSSNISICQGEIVLAVATSFNAANYLWSDGYKGVQNNIKQSGSYKVRAISSDGCLSPESDALNIVVRSDLSPTRPIITVIGDTVLCTGESVKLQTQLGFTTYEWSNISNNTSQITVNPIQKTPYSVRVTTSAGCKSAWSESIFVQTLTKPDKPIITLNRNCMATQVLAEKYQWSWNNNIIQGATKQFHLAVERGKYTVKAYNGRCESIPSDAVNY